jgi:transmembrane sensor
MSKLRTPLDQHLTEQVDEATIARVWSGVQRRRHGSRFGSRRAISVRSWALAAAALALCSIALVLLVPRTRVSSPLDATASGPLFARTGRALNVLGGAVALTDGSQIELDPEARLEVLENTGKTFVSVLRRGRGRFAVQPGGPRRWTIEAGLATIEVIGTRFSVARAERGVEVEVEHGVVLVRSDWIRDRVQRLSAGQRLFIPAPSPSPSSAPLAPPPLNQASSSAAALSPAPLSPAPLSPALPIEQLLEQADERRRRGDVPGAEAALRLALSAHGNEPRAALAAFTLGKLMLDAAGRPAEAAQAFSRCLALAPPAVLAEDALARLAEASAQAGDLAGARSTAQQYRQRYPNGRHLIELDRWLDQP